MKFQQPQSWSPPPSSSASTSSLSGEDADVEDHPPYDSDELQYPSSDSDLKSDAYDSSTDTSSQGPSSPHHDPLLALRSTNTSPVHHSADSRSTTEPNMDFCIVERVDEEESFREEDSGKEKALPSSTTHPTDQESTRASTTAPDVKTTRPQEVQASQNADPAQHAAEKQGAAAGEQRASPSQLLPSLLDYDAVLTTTCATKEATCLDPRPSIHTPRKLDVSPTIITGPPKPTEQESSSSRNKKRFAQESRLFMLAVCASTLLVLGITLVVRSIGSAVVQPSHAFLRHVDYPSDGLLGVAHIDLYTSKGTPFLSERVHPFHARVVFGDSHKNWSPQTTQASNLSDSKAPSVQDLGNGTYKLHLHRPPRAHYEQPKQHQHQHQHRHQRYQNKNQNQNQHGAGARWFKSWLCPEVSQYYLHLWFENGTRVPNTPFRLEWSTTIVPLQGRDSPRTETETQYHSHSTSTYSTRSAGAEDHFQDDQEQGAMRPWTNGLQPVLCELYKISEVTLVFTVLLSQMILSLVSQSIDRLFGVEDFMSTYAVAGWTHAKLMVSKALSLCGKSKGRPAQQDASSSSSSSTSESASTDLMVLLDQKVKSLTRAVERVSAFAGIQLPTATKVLETTDRILVVVEDQVVKLLKSKRVQRIAHHFQAHEIFHRADRVFLRTEQELDRLLKTEFVQDVHQRVKSKMEELQATPQGERWSHRLQALRRGVDRRWTRLQTSLLQDD